MARSALSPAPKAAGMKTIKTATAKPVKTTAKPAIKPAPVKTARAAAKPPVKKISGKVEIKTMTGLLAYLAETADISKATAKTYYATLLEVIKRQLKKEGRMALTGLGVFRVAKRPRREGRNPRTGEKIIIKASKSVKFRMAKAFKEDIL